MENCRLCGLPDLKQELPYVEKYLHSWILKIVSRHDFDGIRIDTLAHVSKTFWPQFGEEIGVFQIAEVLKGDINWVTPYQSNFTGVFNFPIYFDIKKVWGKEKKSIKLLVETLK